MITVPAHRVKQFGVEFFQASFSAKDIDRLVKFEVLGYSGAEEPPKGKQRANRTSSDDTDAALNRHAARCTPASRPLGPEAGPRHAC